MVKKNSWRLLLGGSSSVFCLRQVAGQFLLVTAMADDEDDDDENEDNSSSTACADGDEDVCADGEVFLLVFTPLPGVRDFGTAKTPVAKCVKMGMVYGVMVGVV